MLWFEKLGSETHVPGRSSVVGLSSIVISLSMAAHEQDLVVDVAAAFSVKDINVVFKFLPLSE